MSHSDRIEQVKQALAEQESDAFLVTGNVNTYYFSGFYTVSDGDYPLVLIPQEGDPQLFVSGLDKDAAAYASDIDLHVPEDGFVAAIQDALAADAAVLVSDTMRLKLYQKLVTDLSVTVDSDIIPDMRQYKTPDELSRIRDAYQVTEQAVASATTFVAEEGTAVTEKAVAAEIEHAMRTNGSQGTAFPSVVATGASSSMPHHSTSDAAIERGPLLLDVGAVMDRYCSDMSRTVHLGEPSDQFLQVYEAVQAAQEQAEDMIAPGVDASAVDDAARDVLEEHGYGDNFPHSTGHGVGLQVHESPNLSPNSDVMLDEGMVITVEPGVYLKGEFGVRIEDAYHVTEDGAERLTESSRDLTVIDT